MALSDRLKKQLEGEEGLRLSPYMDCCGKPWRECQGHQKGKLTIGYGHNLDDRPIPQAVADLLLQLDVDAVQEELFRRVPWSQLLDPVRRDALLDLAFNEGVSKLINANPRMLLRLQAGDWAGAAAELLDGPWKTQVGARAQTIANELRSGVASS